MRWILIIAASVTCLDMSGDLQQKSQIFHFCHPWYDQGCFLFFFAGVWIEESKQSANQEQKQLQQCQAGDENNKQRGRNEFTPDSVGVKAINSPPGWIRETTRSVVFSGDNKSETNLLKSQLESWHLNLPNTQQRKTRDEGQKPKKTAAVGLGRREEAEERWVTASVCEWASWSLQQTPGENGRAGSLPPFTKQNQKRDVTGSRTEGEKEWEKRSRPEQEVCVRLGFFKESRTSPETCQVRSERVRHRPVSWPTPSTSRSRKFTPSLVIRPLLPITWTNKS